MAHQGDRLAMIGDEGFSLIDKHFYASTAAGQVHSRHQTQYRRSNHCASQYQNQQKECVYYGPRTATVTLKVPAATEATSYYYGGSDQPAAREYEPPVMTCDEAAQKFGGLVIADHVARSRRRSSLLGF